MANTKLQIDIPNSHRPSESSPSLSGEISFVSWERLLPYIELAVARRKDEKIVGIVADHNGIVVKFK